MRRSDLRTALFAVLAFACLSGTPSRAEILDMDAEFQIYEWPRWQKGIELGTRALGRFGQGSNLNSPPGDILIQASAHLWGNHLFELHGDVGLGINNGTLLYGIGTRINLIEFIEDPTKEMMVRGLQRGLLSKVIRNFMLQVGADFLHFQYRTPDPSLGLNYALQEWKIIPTIGAQWYFYIPQSWAGRFYLDTSIGYTQSAGSNYFIPLIALGAELL